MRTSCRKFMLRIGNSGCYANAKLYRRARKDFESRIELAMRYAALQSCSGGVMSDREQSRGEADVAVQEVVNRYASTGRIRKTVAA